MMKLILTLFSSLIINTVVYAAPTGTLNDTGITQCSNKTANGLTCPQADFPGQDAEYGWDVSQNDNSDGYAGFSYTKLDSNGYDLTASATSWSCVKDNVTGLIWEIKTDDGGLRDKYWTYTWYNTNTSTNGGNAGTENKGICFDNENCDTEKYVIRVNELDPALCGYSDWRMPFKHELDSLLVKGGFNPAIDISYFLNTIYTFANNYWSASIFAKDSSNAWNISFWYGGSGAPHTGYSSYVRLVRDGQ